MKTASDLYIKLQSIPACTCFAAEDQKALNCSQSLGHEALAPCKQIGFSMLIFICLRTTIESFPLWVLLEQPHSATVLYDRSAREQQGLTNKDACVAFIERKSMIDASGQDNHVPWLTLHPDPLVLDIADIKIAPSFQEVANFLILVKMLLEEFL